MIRGAFSGGRGRRYLLAFIILVSAAAGTSPELRAAQWEIKGDQYIRGMALREAARFERTWTDGFRKILDIRPGMTVLDIGTGTGQYASAFAGELEGTGEVFATDIMPELVAWLSGEAEKRGLKNLRPVQVSRDGLDPFYGSHTYDLITLFHVSVIHLSKVDYFRKLRESLASGGRLVMTYEVRYPPFVPENFTDFAGLAGELAAEPGDSPFRLALRESTRELLAKGSPGEHPGSLLKNAIVEDFNGIVSDVAFGGSFAEGMSVSGDASFSPEARAYADWLMLQLKSKGVFDGADLWFDDRKNAETLNRMLLVQRFRRHLAEGLTAPHGHGDQGGRIVEKLEAAGYRLERIYDDVVPFEVTLVFTSR